MPPPAMPVGHTRLIIPPARSLPCSLNHTRHNWPPLLPTTDPTPPCSLSVSPTSQLAPPHSIILHTQANVVFLRCPSVPQTGEALALNTVETALATINPD
jgi:hypothetical protein